MKTVSKSTDYVIASRRIAGTRAEKVVQVDAAIQELLDLKLLESASDRPNVQFVAVPRRAPWLAVTTAVVVMLVLLILLLWVRPRGSHSAAGNPVAAALTAHGTPAHTGQAPVVLPQRIGVS